MKYVFLLSVLTLFMGCNSPVEDDSPWKVKYEGALKNIMKKGDLSAHIQLEELRSFSNLYALGAKENLKGEIQIFNSKSFNSMAKEDGIMIDTSYYGAATLLVFASVEKWKETAIEDGVETYKELEKFIVKSAIHHGLSADHPFPFRIIGKVTSIDWHVINWKDGDMEHSHEKHINSGINETLQHTDVELIGFYSDSHHSIFTHHTTDMHIHFKSKSGDVAGHVDGLLLGGGMKLYFPDQ